MPRIGMYHRRLFLLAGLSLVGFLVIAARASYLTIIEARESRAAAEQLLERVYWTPTRRGSILDRTGVVLAEDRPSFDVEISYSVLTGKWARARARDMARQRYARAWAGLSEAEHEQLIAPYQAALTDRVREMWRLISRHTGVDQEILDTQRLDVIDKVERANDAYIAKLVETEKAKLIAKGHPPTPGDLARIEARLRNIKRIREAADDTPHPVAFSVGDEAGFALLKLAPAEEPLTIPAAPGDEPVTLPAPLLPGLRIVDSGRRAYPRERMSVMIDRSTFPPLLQSDEPARVAVTGVACHVIGWMRETYWSEDAHRRREKLGSDAELRSRSIVARGTDRGEYRAGDGAGAAGVELDRESTLRGLRGHRVDHVDSGEAFTVEPEPGRNVHLSLDIRLQARVQALLSPELGLAVVQEWNQDISNELMPLGAPINGAAIVLGVDTGEILALVSTPTFTRDDVEERWESLVKNINDTPLVNRAIAKRYAPGSIVKALMLSGAVTKGRVRLDERIACTGHFLPGRTDVMRCWIYKMSDGQATHSGQLGHDLLGSEALMVSCNMYFYTLGHRLGVEGVRDIYSRFGVGTPWDLGLGFEHTGTLGRYSDAGADLTDSTDAIFMAIGQGPVDWTPLHAADAYATLARGGVRIRPHIMLDRSAPTPIDVGLDSGAIAEALHGLDLSVNNPSGTGHHITFAGRRVPTFNAPGVKVWGKTGTADAGLAPYDPDGPGPEKAAPAARGDHSWFVVLVGADAGRSSRPEYAIAVVMDHAGSGGRVSGPICNQIIHALIEEGYLPRRTTSPGRSSSL